jgi:hypothetical protein
MQDGKLRNASKAAKNILDAHGAPQNLEIPYADRQIFETSNELMLASIEYTTRPSGLEDARAAQHLNFTAPAYGGDGHANSMDHVDRSGFPDVAPLQAECNGQGTPFTPPAALNTSP